MFWNKVFDYVKYAQGYWLLRRISLFLRDHGLSLDGLDPEPFEVSGDESFLQEKLQRSGGESERNVPMVICGDFNSRPSSSLIHLMHNKDYLYDKCYDPCDPDGCTVE